MIVKKTVKQTQYTIEFSTLEIDTITNALEFLLSHNKSLNPFGSENAKQLLGEMLNNIITDPKEYQKS